MNTELERRKQEITRSQGRRKLWQRIVSALAAVVMFVTTYVLILPVEAQNRTFCNAEAHEHSAENGCYVETKTLKCEEKHEHTDECYITLLTLICQHEEHVHNKECYADKTADVETQQDWEASIKAAKLTGEWSKDIISIASTQLGYRESERNYILGENNEIKGYTRYGDWIGDKYTDWSAAFAAFCVNYTGISKDEMTYDKVPEEWAELVKNDEQFNENITETNPGDIVFIDSDGDNKADRVGIVVENTEGKIKTVEGDLNNSVACFEYQLSAQTARTDVEFSNENSNNSAAAGDSRADQADVEFSNENSNNKDFSEEKSTTGRAARAEEKLIIIGSVSLPKNPNYNPPIAITDPENPDATSEPGNRVNPTSSPDNRVTPSTPPSSRDNRAPSGYTAPPVPTLTNLDPTTKVAVLFNGSTVEEYTTLADALDGIDQASASEFTVVFTQNYSMSAADGTAMATDKKGSSASKIYFTSCYNNGTADVTSSFAAGNYFIANTETDIYNLTFSGACHIQGGGNKLTIGTGVVGNTSSSIWGGLLNANLESDTDVSVFSGTWHFIGGGSYRTGGAYTLTGNSNCYIGGTTVTTYASGGCHTTAQTGNTSLLVTDDATVTYAQGSSYSGAMTNSDASLTINGNAIVHDAVGGSGGAFTGNIVVNVSGSPRIGQLTSNNQSNVLAGSSIVYNIDGSDGAVVLRIFLRPRSSGSVAAGVDVSLNFSDIKDISFIDAYNYCSSSGKVTISGDCQVQYYFYTNTLTDVELAANATLQMGSNSDLSQSGNAGEFRGQMQFLKSLIMNANSKLIMAGDSHSNPYRTVKNIDVRGAGAEIDIYKRGTTAYPIQVSGEKLGSDKLKLGIFKAPDVDTADPVMTDILLTFSASANARENNHAPGAVTNGNTYERDLEGVYKDGNNIIPAVNCDYDAPDVPTLTGLASTTKVAVVYGSTVEEYTTLADALDGIDQASASEFTVVFTQNYTMSAADYTAMWTDKKGSSASKIYFTSCYNNGTADVTSSFAAGNYFIANTETDIYNLTFSGACHIQGGGNKLTIGTGVVGNTSSSIWGGLFNASLDSDTDLSVFSGTWSFIGGGSYRSTGAYTLTGNSNCYIGGATVTTYASGGGHTAAQTGNTSLTMGGSAKATYAFGGAYGGAITGNTLLTIGGSATVTYAHGSSYGVTMTNGNACLTINGNAIVNDAIGGSYGAFTGNIVVNVSGSPRIGQLTSNNQSNVLAGSSIVYNIDGSDGAVVRRIFLRPYSSGSVAAGVDVSLNFSDIKDISFIDAYNYCSSSGKVTISGDCQVQYYFYTNTLTDVELAANATLQMGSNSDLSQSGNAGEFRGQMHFMKSLIMNANSKLIMAGDSAASTSYRRIGESLDVRGAGAEIDIFKNSSGSMPIYINGQYVGSEKLALGIFMDPHSSPTAANMNDILLQFSSADNAVKTDYIAGDNVTYVYKRAAYITASLDTDIIFMDGSRPIRPLQSGLLTNILQRPTGVYNYPDALYQVNLAAALHTNYQSYNSVPDGAVVAHYKLYNAAKIGQTSYDIEVITNLCTGYASNNITALHDITNNNYTAVPTDQVAGSYIRSYIAVSGVSYRFLQVTTIKFYRNGEDQPARMPQLAYGNTGWQPYVSATEYGEIYSLEDHGYDLYAINPNKFFYNPAYGGYQAHNFTYGSTTESTTLYTFTKDGTTSFSLLNMTSGGGLEIPFLRFTPVTSSSVEIEKHFSGAPTQTSGESCTFLVQQCDADGNPTSAIYDMTDASITQMCADGTVVSGFGNCTYYYPGTYYNLITETACSGTYLVDATRYLQTVTVTFDDTNFVLNVSESYKNLETGETVDRPSFNNRYSLHKLTLDETIIGGGASTAFPFTVEITDSTGNNIYQIPAADIKVYDASGNDITPATIVRDTEGNPVISLGDGWSIVIENIPHNYIVTITETGFSGYSCDISGDGTETAADSGITQPIVMNGDKTVHYLNERSTVELTITKTVVGGGTGPFSFEITFADASGDPVNIPAPAANAGYTVTNNVATFDLNKDGSVTITGIPVDTVATIVETSHNGYTVQYNFSDGTPSVSGDTAEVTITDDLTVTCINNAGFELPHTGGTGSLILTLGGVILVATALMYGISSKRRQWRAWI